jgi:hypothetical protein
MPERAHSPRSWRELLPTAPDAERTAAWRHVRPNSVHAVCDGPNGVGRSRPIGMGCRSYHRGRRSARAWARPSVGSCRPGWSTSASARPSLHKASQFEMEERTMVSAGLRLPWSTAKDRADSGPYSSS